MRNALLIDGRPPTVLWFAPAALLLLATLDNLGAIDFSRGYFGFMCLAVTLAAAALAFLRLRMEARDSWGWAFIALALLYNPAWPPYFNSACWFLINSAGCAVFIFGGRRLSRADHAETTVDASLASRSA